MSSVAYANLTIDGQSLLLPQIDLLHIELVTNIQPHSGKSGDEGSGFVEFDEQQWPVFTLSHDLLPLDTLPEQRRLVACIQNGNQPFALACDTVTTLQFSPGAIFEELPEVMRNEKAPIQALLYNQGMLHFLTNADALSRLLPRGDSKE